MDTASYRQPLNTAFVIGAPLALAVLEIFHPLPHDLFQVDVGRWLWVHYLQIPLFPLAALALTLLVGDRCGRAGLVCRIAMFVFGVSYVAFDTAAGVVTGVLVAAAQANGTVESYKAPLMTIWLNPIIGGAGPAPLLAVIGAVAWSVGALAAAIGVRLAGGSAVAVLLLLISSLSLSVFRTHAWPGGPLSFGALAAAAGLLEWERRRKPGIRAR